MTEGSQAVVAIVCSVPLLAEALQDTLDGIAEPTVVASRQPELAALLKALGPDAIIVDDEREAAVAATYARFARVPVIRVDPAAATVELLDHGGWIAPEQRHASPETVRDLVAGGISVRRSRA